MANRSVPRLSRGAEVRVSGKFLSDDGVFVALVVFVQSEPLEGKPISIEQGDGEVDLSSSPICASVLHVQCASFWIWRSAALRSN